MTLFSNGTTTNYNILVRIIFSSLSNNTSNGRISLELLGSCHQYNNSKGIPNLASQVLLKAHHLMVKDLHHQMYPIMVLSVEVQYQGRVENYNLIQVHIVP
jgi:hypothetical protein